MNVVNEPGENWKVVGVIYTEQGFKIVSCFQIYFMLRKEEKQSDGKNILFSISGYYVYVCELVKIIFIWMFVLPPRSLSQFNHGKNKI